MAYDSLNGRRPLEYASKVNHSDIIQSPEIKEFFATYKTIELDLGKHIMPKGNEIRFGTPKNISNIFAIDGAYQNAIINAKFPSISLAYFNIGVLSFKMMDYESITSSELIDPGILKKLKDVSKICFVMPTNNIVKDGVSSFKDSVRIRIHEIFSDKKYTSLKNDTLNSILEWVIFEKWNDECDAIDITCPNESCQQKISFSQGETIKKCPDCGKEVYLSDYLNLHKLITDPNGANGIISYVCNTVEQLFIAEIIKFAFENEKDFLGDVVIIKDGPLAFFSKTFRLCLHYRNLFTYISKEQIPIYLVGIEKSGAFVEHANLIKDKMQEGKFYIFNEDYIKKYVEPVENNTIYGSNTYYGKKVMFKTEAGDILVAVLPVNEYTGETKSSDLIGAEVCLQTLSKLRCNMYDNSLVPIAVINKLVSIAELPSADLLEKFSKKAIKTI